ncbi:MAG: ABC transporter, partial [Butyricimonas faecihominis]
YDASSTKWNTLTPQSQEIVSKLYGDMSITAYVNVLSPNYALFSFPHFIQSNRELFKQYERFKPETKLKVVYYYDTITVEDSPAYAETFANKLKKDGMTLWEAAKGCEISN